MFVCEQDTASSIKKKCVRHVHLHALYMLYNLALLFDTTTANLKICLSNRSHLIPKKQ